MVNGKNIIGLALKELLEDKNHQLLCLLEYYSYIDSDDLCLVGIFFQAPLQGVALLNNIPVINYSYPQSLEMARLRDPLITDPILTGKLIWGKPEPYSELMKHTNIPPKDRLCVSYLINRSCQEYISGKKYQKQYELTTKKDAFLRTIIKLRYSIACLCLASFYLNNPAHTSIPMKLLEQKPEGLFLKEIKRFGNRIISEPNDVSSIEKINFFFDRIEDQILRSSIIGGINMIENIYSSKIC